MAHRESTRTRDDQLGALSHETCSDDVVFQPNDDVVLSVGQCIAQVE